MVGQFVPLLLVIAVAVLLSLLFLGISTWLGPSRPTALKRSTYECGIPPRSGVQVRFFVRFFLVALLFLHTSYDVLRTAIGQLRNQEPSVAPCDVRVVKS